MTPRALILTGTLVCVGALLLAGLGATLRGSFNPECDLCAPLSARALLFAALPVAILGAVLVAMGIVRREAAQNGGSGGLAPQSDERSDESPKR